MFERGILCRIPQVAFDTMLTPVEVMEFLQKRKAGRQKFARPVSVVSGVLIVDQKAVQIDREFTGAVTVR